ncbi:FkbM family methyltransferase [Candidatus Pelagibacter sp.]|nr:FkbM family methyltransferase [Candidatus Pelagibacter sp.]
MLYSKIIIILLNFLDYFQQKKIIKLINSKFSKPIIVFDIGAHHGETIRLFLSKLKINKIYSFEASPQNFKVLKKKISKKLMNKVEIYNFGLGDKISKSYINQAVESSSSTMNELNEESKYLKKKLQILNIKDKDVFYHKIPVHVSTLDSFIEEHDIQNIDVLKIDTEGYEFNILKGALKCSQKINLIYFEHHYDDMIIKNYKFGDIHKLLENQSFKMIKKSKMLFRKSFEYVYENQKK